MQFVIVPVSLVLCHDYHLYSSSTFIFFMHSCIKKSIQTVGQA